LKEKIKLKNQTNQPHQPHQPHRAHRGCRKLLRLLHRGELCTRWLLKVVEHTNLPNNVPNFCQMHDRTCLTSRIKPAQRDFQTTYRNWQAKHPNMREML
jgi:hypothetical protein